MNSDGASPSWYTGVEPYPGPSAYPKPSSQASKSAEKPTVDRPSVPKSLSSTSSKSSAQYVARTSVNNVQKPDTDFDENDPSCACGAGSLLGVFRGIPIYENHKQIDCVMFPMKLKINYLLPAFFNILQEMELVIDDSSLRYAHKILNLLKIWNKFQLTIPNNPCSGAEVFLHFGFSELAALVLQPEWEQIKYNTKFEFIEIMKLIIHKMKIMNKEDAVQMTTSFILILKSPWNHEHITKLLSKEHPSYEQMENLIKFERSTILLHRLKIFCKTEDQLVNAIKFSFLATRFYEKKLVNDKKQTFFPEEDYECVRDIYYGVLIKFNHYNKLASILEKYNPNTRGLKLMQRCCNKIKHLTSLSQEDRPFFHEIQVTFCEFASTIMVFNSLRSENMYEAFCKLLHYWIEIMILLQNSDLDNAHLLSIRNCYTFNERLYDIMKNSNSSKYLYSLAEIMMDKLGSKVPRTFYVTIYVFALNKNINESVYSKRFNDKNISFKLLNSIVKGYLDMADLFEDMLCVSRECVLTAYTLMPSLELLAKVEEQAIKSDKLIVKDSTNVPSTSSNNSKNDFTTKKPPNNKTNNKSTQVHTSDYIRELFEKGKDCHTIICSELDKLNPNKLNSTLKDNLINVLWQPRIGTVNWDLKWPEMKIVCEQYLYNSDLVINRNMVRQYDLKFLNLDIPEYNVFAEMTMNILTNKTDNSNEDEKNTSSPLEKTVPNFEKSSKGKSSTNSKRRNCVQMTKQSESIVSANNSETQTSLRIQSNEEKSKHVSVDQDNSDDSTPQAEENEPVEQSTENAPTPRQRTRRSRRRTNKNKNKN